MVFTPMLAHSSYCEKLFKLRSNPLGLERFSREEKVQIELLQLLRDLNCPLKSKQSHTNYYNGGRYNIRSQIEENVESHIRLWLDHDRDQ